MLNGFKLCLKKIIIQLKGTRVFQEIRNDNTEEWEDIFPPKRNGKQVINQQHFLWPFNVTCVTA